MQGEFSFRAVVHGKMSVFKAERISALVSARSPLERDLAANGLDTLSHSPEEMLWKEWKQQLVQITASVEVGLDFEDVEISDDQMMKVFEKARNLRETVKVQIENSQNMLQKVQKAQIAIIGPPNVGKSSLINYLAQEDVSIVTDIPGTTRDKVTKDITLGKQRIELIDTAGVRNTTDDPIERLGIAKSV